MRLIPLALLLLSIPAAAQIENDAVHSHYKQIDFNWSYTTDWPVCSTTLVSCYTGFTMSDTGTGHVLAGPSVIGPTTLSWAYFPKGGVQYGSHTFALVANGYDQNGQAVTSTPATVTINVVATKLSTPVSLRGVLQ